jgi:hypothetical protein
MAQRAFGGRSHFDALDPDRHGVKKVVFVDLFSGTQADVRRARA